MNITKIQKEIILDLVTNSSFCTRELICSYDGMHKDRIKNLEKDIDEICNKFNCEKCFLESLKILLK